MKTQKQEILNYLLSKGSINQWKAFSLFRISRLSAIIWQLKQEGFKIKTIRYSGFKPKSYYVEYMLDIPRNLPNFV